MNRSYGIVSMCQFYGNSNNYDLQTGADDVNFVHNQPDGLTINDGGARTRWNRVTGGGPLGGVDLSSIRGQYDGQLAVADGTSAAAAGAWAR
jgi:hypothetical protein